MKATDVIRVALTNSRAWALGLIQDMQDAPLTAPTPNGGNHPLWVLGHLVRSESDLLDGFVLGQGNRFPELEAFSIGQTPDPAGTGYPSMAELLEKWDQMREATFAHLDTLSDEDLDQKSNAPEEFGPPFATVGACFVAMSTHVTFHAGQVADARRAAGRDPLMA